jgi:hypothetical protein
MSPPGALQVFSSCRHRSCVRHDRITHLRLLLLLELSLLRRNTACTVAIGTRTSPGIRSSPSAHETEGARSSRRFHPPAHSVLGESHPFDVLLRPSPGRACFIPAYAPGVHPVTPSRAVLSAVSRRLLRGPSPGLSLPSRQPGRIARASFPSLRPPKSGCPDHGVRVIRSLHHERIGMFSASCEGRDPCPPEVFDVLSALA